MMISISRKRKTVEMPRDPSPEVERIVTNLCEPGGKIETIIRQESDNDLILAAAVADRVFAQMRPMAQRLARAAAAEAERAGSSKRQTYIRLADLLGRSRSTVAERLKLY